MKDLVIREASFEEMSFFLSHAKDEGWNPGLHDAPVFYQTDPHGFFIATVGKEKVGCISAVAYDAAFGFIGFYIVLSAHRGHGYGHQLWARGMNYLGDRVIGLDGVLARQHDYEQSHFKLYYKNQRFERKGGGGRHSDALVNLTKIPFELVQKYDFPIFGLQRENFLREWIQMPNAYALGKVKDEKLLGYGVLRKCHLGYKVGPLFADDANCAMEIFDALCAQAGNESVFIDLPQVNPQTAQLIKSFDLKSNFETVRMYTKTPPKQQLEKNFGVTTFELG